jgi:hypothetical protein
MALFFRCLSAVNVALQLSTHYREYLNEVPLAEDQVPQVARVLDNVAAGIDKAAKNFESAMVRAH